MGSKTMGHVVHTTPFVTCQQAHRDALFENKFVACLKPKSDFTPLGLIEPYEIAGIEIDASILV